MNYFIDFEATQFSNEIISIGCVRDDGNQFYSEVKARKKITPFITSLTGITNEQNKSASTSDEVFDEFFDWLMEVPDERAIFYCYGSADINFVKKNLALTKTFKAQVALSTIGMSLFDYSKTVKEHFGLVKQISLAKIVAYYRGVESIEQSHNALDDAMLLREVFGGVTLEKIVEGHPFPDYEINNCITPKEKEKINKESEKAPKNILRGLKHKVEMYDRSGEVLEKTFKGIVEARQFVMNKLGPIDKEKTSKAKVENKIINANRKNTPYNGHYWKIIVLESLKGDKV